MDLLESQPWLFVPSLTSTFSYQIISNIHPSTDIQSKVATGHSLKSPNLIQLPQFAEVVGAYMSCPGSFSYMKSRTKAIFLCLCVCACACVNFFNLHHEMKVWLYQMVKFLRGGFVIMVYWFASRANPSLLPACWYSLNIYWLDIYQRTHQCLYISKDQKPI